MGNLELIYKTETGSQMQKINYGYQSGKGVEEDTLGVWD